jgi:hypothetical protein
LEKIPRPKRLRQTRIKNHTQNPTWQT